MRDCGFARGDLCVKAKTPEKTAGNRLPVRAAVFRKESGADAAVAGGEQSLSCCGDPVCGSCAAGSGGVLGYDLLVKDTPFSPDWICYENLHDPVRYDVRNLEREMFQVLDRAVKKYNLSFTECRFPKLDGSSGKRK